jgi:hypothetical protein
MINDSDTTLEIPMSSIPPKYRPVEAVPDHDNSEDSSGNESHEENANPEEVRAGNDSSHDSSSESSSEDSSVDDDEDNEDNDVENSDNASNESTGTGNDAEQEEGTSVQSEDDAQFGAWAGNPLLRGIGPLTNHQEVLRMRDKVSRHETMIAKLQREKDELAKALEEARRPAGESGTKVVVAKAEPMPFAKYEQRQGESQLHRFRIWARDVTRAIDAAETWSEGRKTLHFKLNCGEYLQTIIEVYNMEPPPDHQEPFKALLSALDKHFVKSNDPILDYRTLSDCKQGHRETIEEFHVRFMRLAHERFDKQTIRAHFFNNLRDRHFASMAATGGWSIERTVRRACRHEALGGPQPLLPQPMEVAAVGNDGPGPSSRQGGGWGGQRQAGNWNRKGSGDACQNCGVKLPHRGNKCPAQDKGRKCLRCDRPGHFAIMCPEKKRAAASGRGRHEKRQALNQVQAEDNYDD